MLNDRSPPGRKGWQLAGIGVAGGLAARPLFEAVHRELEPVWWGQDPFRCWPGQLAFLGPGRVGPLVAAAAAAALLTRLLQSARTSRPTLRWVGGFVAAAHLALLFSALSAWLDDSTSPGGVSFDAVFGFVLGGAFGAWVASSRLPARPVGPRARWAPPLAAGVVVLLGFATALDLVDQLRPKDYPPFVLELLPVVEHDGRGPHSPQQPEHLRWVHSADLQTSSLVDPGSGLRLTAIDLRRIRLTPRRSGPARIELSLTTSRTEDLFELTSKQVGRELAFVLDGELLMQPVVRSPLFGGTLLVVDGQSGPGFNSLYERLTGDAPPD